MVFFYKGAGLVADAALLTNVVLLLGTLSAFGAVLTLPGIAGLVLTMGMAVDANVIIYERIKEEIKAGKGIGKAVADGYSNAYSAIIDGQVTTLLTGIVLFFFGSGPIKGFATTLIIGIITSVLTSIFISRLIIDDRIKAGKSVSFETRLTRNFLKNTHVDFISGRKWSYTISGILILISIASMCFKGFTYGVDFTGGRTYVVRFDQPVTAEEVREATGNTFNLAAHEQGITSGAAVEVKQFGGESQMKITTAYKVEDESIAVDDEIEHMLYESLKGFYLEDLTFEEFTSTLENPNGIISSDKVGASIANDIQRNALISVFLALLVIFAYIAVRFKGWTWGIGGVVALAHTTVIVIGFFSLFSGILPFNLDIDQTFIAAILTIIGYAINDVVVIFDRRPNQGEPRPASQRRLQGHGQQVAQRDPDPYGEHLNLDPAAYACNSDLRRRVHQRSVSGPVPRYHHRYLRVNHDRNPHHVRHDHEAPQEARRSRWQDRQEIRRHFTLIISPGPAKVG